MKDILMNNIIKQSKSTMIFTLLGFSVGPTLMLLCERGWVKFIGILCAAYGVYCLNFLVHTIEALCKCLDDIKSATEENSED